MNTSDSAPGAKDADRPASMNKRMGYNMGFFQYSQPLPLPEGSFPFPVDQIYDTGTDALVYLTIDSSYQPWDDVTDAAIDALAKQCADINKGGRQVLLRFWPEMNGNWFAYGQQPVKYVAMLKNVYNAVKAQANQTYFMWAPNNAVNYPYTAPIDIGGRETKIDGNGAPAQLNHEEYHAMDTNNNGRVARGDGDDPFSPYYPGDDYVDWVGMSVYFYSTGYPADFNSLPPDNEFMRIMTTGDFYEAYAVGKGKPFAVTETAASYHLNNELTDPSNPSAPNPSELAIKQAWWRQFLTSKDFLEKYSKIHLISLFEFQKHESRDRIGNYDERDFKITVKDEIRNAFLSDFAEVKNMFMEAVNGGEAMKNNPKTGKFPSTDGSGAISHSVFYGIHILLWGLSAFGIYFFI